MEHKCAVATHTGLTAVKHGRFVDVVSMGQPVQVAFSKTKVPGYMQNLRLIRS
jgi:hypothetical protein